MWCCSHVVGSIGVLVLGAAAGASIDVIVSAPATVPSGEAYTIEVWAAFDVEEGPHGAALGFFNLSLLNTLGGGGVASISSADIQPAFQEQSDAGAVSTPDLLDVAGAQGPNFNGTFNPDITLDNPVLLFTTQVQTAPGFFGDLTYQAALAGDSSSLHIYVDSWETLVITDLATPVTLRSATTTVVPGPPMMSVALILGAISAHRRRR